MPNFPRTALRNAGMTSVESDSRTPRVSARKRRQLQTAFDPAPQEDQMASVQCPSGAEMQVSAAEIVNVSS